MVVPGGHGSYHHRDRSRRLKSPGGAPYSRSGPVRIRNETDIRWTRQCYVNKDECNASQPNRIDVGSSIVLALEVRTYYHGPEPGDTP